jgi:transcriptional regulator
MLGDNRDYLYGHFARPNPQWKDVEGQTVLAVFHGPHCYVSPSWYETHRAVPTWNYISVHVNGKIEWMSGDELADSLSDLVRKYEAPGSSYRLDEVEEEFLEGLSHGIVGFKIKIEYMEGKAKLSQNHSIERQKLVIQKLERIESENEQQIAAHMNAQTICAT